MEWHAHQHSDRRVYTNGMGEKSQGGRSSDAGVKGPFYPCSTASGCVSTLGLPELLGAEVAGNTYPVTKLKVYPLL